MATGNPILDSLAAQEEEKRRQQAALLGANPVDAPPAAKRYDVIDPTRPVWGINQAPPPVVDSPGAPPLAHQPAAPAGDDILKNLHDANEYARNQGQAQAAALANVGPSIKTTRAVETAEERALKPQIAAAAKAEIGAADKASDARIQAAQAAKDQADAEAAGVEASRKESEEKSRAENEKFAAGQKYSDEERQRIISDGAKGYWEDKPTGARVAAALMAGIGQFASALSGGPNTALQIINKAIDDDAQRKQFKAREEISRLGVKGEDAEKMHAAALVEIANGKSAAAEALLMKRQQMQARSGIDAEVAAKDVQNTGLQKKALEERQRAEAGLRKLVQVDNEAQIRGQIASRASGAGRDLSDNDKQVSEDQRKANALVMRAFAEAKNLNKMPGYSPKAIKELENWRRAVSEIKDTDPSRILSAVSSINGDVMGRLSKSSPQDAARFNAEVAWGEAVLRDDSGGMIGPKEQVDRISGIQKARGDSPEILAQKSQRMMGQMAALASKTHKPNYWEQELSSLYGGKPQAPSAKDIASLNMALQSTQDPAERERILQVLRSVGGR